MTTSSRSRIRSPRLDPLTREVDLWTNVHPGPSTSELLAKERPPPPRPLCLDFPNYVPPRTTHPLSRRRMLSLRSSILRLKRPSDLSDGVLCHLNIHLDTDVSLASLVPDESFQERPFLYDSDLEAMLTELDVSNEDAFRETMRLPPLEGRPKPRLTYSRNFFGGLEDLSHYYDDSKDEYYEVELAAEEEAQTSEDASKERERRNGDIKMGYDDLGSSALLNRNQQHHRAAPPAPSATSMQKSTENDNAKTPPDTTTTKKMKQVYKGTRISNATSLPPTSRTNLVRNLLKMSTHKFTCRDYDFAPREKLRIKDVNFPQGLIMYTFSVVKTPSEMKFARGRFVEGPVLGVSVRHDVVFTPEGKKRVDQMGASSGTAGKEFFGETFDLAKEVGGLLALALQRDREGKGSKEEVYAKETEPWWWAAKERWGGGPTPWGNLACEVYEDEDPSWSPQEFELQMQKRKEAEEEMKKLPFLEDEATAKDIQVEDLLPNEQGAERGQPVKKKNRIAERPRREEGGLNGSGNGNGNRTERKKGDEQGELKDGRRVMYVAPMRKRWYKDWTTVRPNVSMWDDKMIHRKIGAGNSVDYGDKDRWDDVYQVSCVNHHVALMKMRISIRYLRWLKTGEAENKPEADEEDILKIARSKWFDLFDVEQRKEFLVGMWRVMSWVCRKEVPKIEWDKLQALKRGAEDTSSIDSR